MVAVISRTLMAGRASTKLIAIDPKPTKADALSIQCMGVNIYTRFTPIYLFVKYTNDVSTIYLLVLQGNYLDF